MGISTFPAASAGGITARTLKQAIFNTSGTWTYPTSSNFDGTVEVTCVGGGGASGAALNRTSSAYYFGGGGGGGGQVILRKQLSVLNAGNQNVTVGFGGGGYYQTGALFGGVSTFGSGYIKNLYPDPALTKGLRALNASVGLAIYPETRSTSSGVQSIYPYRWTSGTNPPQPPVGKTYAYINVDANASIYGQYVPVKASTEYRVIFSHTYNSSGGTNVDSYIFWFNERGEYLSNSGLTSFTTQSSSGTWTAVTSLVTSPGSAAYGRIMWNSGSAYNFLLNGIQIAESAANVTSVVYGGSSGYGWTGVPDNSYTVGENERLVAAQGGGGGWGACYRITNNGTPYYLPGHAGYTSGGLGLNYGSTSIGSEYALITGCGGGAGGNAKGPETPTQVAYTTNYTIANTSHINSARYGFATDNPEYGWHAGIHTAAAYAGSDSAVYNAGSSNFPFIHFGENGTGIEGFGFGGVGSARTGTSGYGNYFRSTGVTIPNTIIGVNSNYSPTSALHKGAFYSKENTGNGGNGWIGTVDQNSEDYNGIAGGSGVVIVRWYE